MSAGKAAALLAVGFVAGLAVPAVQKMLTQPAPDAVIPAKRRYAVFIDEMKQSIVSFDHQRGDYRKTVTLSNGSAHTVELKPTCFYNQMVLEYRHNGRRVTYLPFDGGSSTGDDGLRVSSMDMGVSPLQECK